MATTARSPPTDLCRKICVGLRPQAGPVRSGENLAWTSLIVLPGFVSLLSVGAGPSALGVVGESDEVLRRVFDDLQRSSVEGFGKRESCLGSDQRSKLSSIELTLRCCWSPLMSFNRPKQDSMTSVISGSHSPGWSCATSLETNSSRSNRSCSVDVCGDVGRRVARRNGVSKGDSTANGTWGGVDGRQRGGPLGQCLAASSIFV